MGTKVQQIFGIDKLCRKLFGGYKKTRTFARRYFITGTLTGTEAISLSMKVENSLFIAVRCASLSGHVITIVAPTITTINNTISFFIFLSFGYFLAKVRISEHNTKQIVRFISRRNATKHKKLCKTVTN